MFDVIVIGGGVVGGMILRTLTKYQLSVCMLEKESDVAMGASKANSGIVHAGFDAAPNSLKAKFNVQGNAMMAQVTKELGVKYRNNGSLVVAFDEEQMQTLVQLKARGEKNGVTGLSILSQKELRKKEPNISDNAVGALYASTGGIVCPYGLTIAAIGNAMDNGAQLRTEFEVCAIQKIDGGYEVLSTDGKREAARVVINCAGLGSGKIASLVGDTFVVGARKGEYILLDRESGDFVSHTLFFTPTAAGKGILVSPTADGNILLGPTATEQADGDTQTTEIGLAHVTSAAAKMCKNPPTYNTITSFSGVRAYSDRHDFVIENSEKAKGIIHCVGVESPGLTAAPAIAKFVVEELVAGHITLTENKNFCGVRECVESFKELSIEEKNALIAKDPSFGKIVCRCEQITEGEILRAIRSNPPAKDIDGVKRRTRSGMGRCQGGFCQPQIAELIAKERKIPMTEVSKKGKGSALLTGVTK